MKKFFKGLMLVLALGVLALAAAVILLPRHLAPAKRVRAIFRPVEAAFGQKSSLNILLLGVDYNYDSKAQRYTKGARSDTILVLRVEPLGKHLSMLSIPRDLYVGLGENASYGYDRINAAYSYGGPELTIETVERITGLRIDHYVAVKSDVVAKLVDAVGGVPIEVEKQMDWDDNWAGLHIHLKPGAQRLSGEQAVGYCRFRRDAEGDFGRIRRQQKFLGALIKELKKPANFTKAPKFAEIVRTEMTTDLTEAQMVGLATLYRSFPLSNIKKGRPEVEDYFANGSAMLILAPGEPRRTIRELFPPLPNPALGRVKVVIEVGPREARRARETAAGLKELGFPMVRVRYRRKDFEGGSQVTVSGVEGEALEALREVFPELPVTIGEKKEGRPTATLFLAGPIGI